MDWKEMHILAGSSRLQKHSRHSRRFGGVALVFLETVPSTANGLRGLKWRGGLEGKGGDGELPNPDPAL